MRELDASTNKEKIKEYDVFKDSLLRYLGYANEVGESFRVLVPVSLVRLSYVVASTYVFCDAVHKGQLASKKESLKNSGEKMTWTNVKKTSIAFTDTLIWQGFASVAIPGFTINRICWFTRMCLRRVPSMPLSVQYWGVVAVGLSCIPAIIKPIDNSVDIIMDRTLRKLYHDEDDR